MLKSGLIRKVRLICVSIDYDFTDWTKNIIKHILSNISRSKGNKTMKFGQLIEYNMKNIFLEESYSKYGGEASPRTFYKK